MCWQALSAYFSTLLISSSSLSFPPRDYLDYSGKTSEGNRETGKESKELLLHDWKCGFIIAGGQLPSGRVGYTLVK